jgi:hypothetical protein
MRHSTRFALVLTLATPFLLNGAAAQQPTPVLMVVQAATAQSKPVTAKPAVTSPENTSSNLEIAIKALQQTKTLNDETLKKQEALLEQLDELQKAAEQLKIFAKRG